MLTSDENEILEAYVESMKKVWKSKDPEERATLLKEVLEEDNTAEFRKIYSRVIEEIKNWAPNLDTLSYHEWTPEVTARVNAWINTVLAGNDPRTASATPEVAATVSAAPAATVSTPSVVSVEADENDDLPF